MRLFMAAFGTRGDLEPLLALGLAMKHRGHQITIGAPEPRRALTESLELQFLPVGSWPAASLSRTVMQLIDEDANPGRRGMKLIHRVLAPVFPEVVRELRAASSGYEGLVVNDLLGVALLDAPPLTNPGAIIAVLTQPFGGFCPLLKERPGLKLIASSRALHPPHAALGDDWVFTGHWLLETHPTFTSGTSLQRFLSAGPTVAVAMGSSWGLNPNLPRALFVAAAREAGVQLVVQELRPSGQSQRKDPGVLTVGEIPYAWLFSRVASVVHHGGAGTSAIALRAGRPCITLPQFGDQHYWALRLEALGVSAATFTSSPIAVDTLAEAMYRSVMDPGLRTAADALGGQIDSRAGLLAACERLEAQLTGHVRRSADERTAEDQGHDGSPESSSPPA